MLHALDWQRGDADDEYAESVSVRQVNESVLQGRFDLKEARQVLAALPQLWLIKDPRFVHTIDFWMPILADFEPTLIWLVRDSQTVAESYRRRGERMWFGLSVEQAIELAAETYARWLWGKCRVDYEQIHASVALFEIANKQICTSWIVKPDALWYFDWAVRDALIPDENHTILLALGYSKPKTEPYPDQSHHSDLRQIWAPHLILS